MSAGISSEMNEILKQFNTLVVLYIHMLLICWKNVSLDDITHVAITAVEAPRDPCNPSPCGANAVCKERNGAGSCTCLPEYSGDPYTGCRPECVLNTDCNRARACVRNKCVDPCPGACGLNAECRVVNHAPSCSCLPGYTGNPLSTCSLPPAARKPLPFSYRELCFITCPFSWSTSKWWNISFGNFKRENLVLHSDVTVHITCI